MRIAFIVSGFPVTSETFILRQITGFIDRGHDVTIFAERWPLKEQPVHAEVTRYQLLKKTIYLPKYCHNKWLRAIQALFVVPFYCARNPKLIRLCWNNFKGLFDITSCALATFYIHPNPYDITHAQFGFIGSRLARLKDIGIIEGPLVTSFRGTDTTTILKKDPNAYTHLFRCADLFLPVSAFIRNLLVRHGCKTENLIVHHSGINCEEFKCFERRAPENGCVRLLCITRLVEVKGIGYLIAAAERLVERGHRIHVDIVGDGPLRRDYKQQILDNHLSGIVRLHRWKDKAEVAHFLKKAHIFVCPSIICPDGAEEGMPNAVKEAMAAKLPVVATNTGGIPELVKDGISGFLVPERDVAALADKLCYLIEHPELWAEMGRAGCEHVKANYDINKLNDQLVELYEQILPGRSLHMSKVRSKIPAVE